jgi:signal recognition particle subunit SRP19
MKTDDFITIYPSYLDSSKTIQQGRRIGKDKAVDTPTVTDISQVLQQLGLRHVVQPHKGYPRDTHTLWDNPGRVKVERPADRVPKITEITDETDLENSEPGGGCKRKLLSDIAERIPSLPSRIQRLAQEAKTRQEAQDKRQEELQALQKQQHRQPSAPGNAKKKGKKKR